MKSFRDRTEAGQRLAARLARLDLAGDVVVLGLPRGGAPVALEVAMELDAPLDVLVVRKLGAPFDAELAVGAIAYGGVTVLNDALIDSLRLDQAALDSTRRRELGELLRRERAYRGDRPPLDLHGKTAIVVDDGMATGATMHAAVVAIRKLDPASIIVAIPSASESAIARVAGVADRVIALETPEPYYGVGAWYKDFKQVGDPEVIAALEKAAARRSESAGPSRVQRSPAASP